MDCLLAASECLISCCLSCLLRLRALHQKRVWLLCKVAKGSYGHPHFKQAQRSRLPPCAACRAVGPPKRHVTVHFTRHGPVAAFPKSRKARVRNDWRSSRQERPTATHTTHIASDPPLTNFNLSLRQAPFQAPIVAPRLILRPVLGASRILLRMAPTQATLGYVKPTQTTLGCVEILPATPQDGLYPLDRMVNWEPLC